MGFCRLFVSGCDETEISRIWLMLETFESVPM